ncbi:hypothetical protein WJX72_000450 [[Myrmecia] bisecta]|uniref:Small integral membrane protein 8 n=1 Tax=[Myrmecia] bisecta TaxID=41462 RepID=A0AAW1R433_9CHLO
MSSPPAKKPPADDFVVTQSGSRGFRALNFELYAKPTGRMRLLAYVGTTAFVGFLGYMTYQKRQIEQARLQSRRA